MSRFNPIKPKLAIVPVTDDTGRTVDAAIVATVETPDESEQPARKTRDDGGRPPRPEFSTVTLTFNAAKNGLQLHFPSKPSDEIRAELKAAGWRWSFRNGCWYHRDTPANQDFAERFVARLNSSAEPGRGSEPAVEHPETEQPAASVPGPGAEVEPMPAGILPTPQIPAWRKRLVPA